MTILFAQPRHVYESYADLRSLIALSGFETVYYDEIDPTSDNVYILTVINGELPENGYPYARARMVCWDLEYHLGGVQLSGVELWAADKWYAEMIGAKYVPMGSHPDLRLHADSTSSERYDVAYVGYFIPRRERIRAELLERGVKVSPIHAWGEERHRILSNSTAYLHVHQHEHIPTIAPLRMVVAAAYGLPVISEQCIDLGVFDRMVIYGDYSWLADLTREAITQPALQDFALRLNDYLCHDYAFRKSVEGAL